jgi:subtilisin family serine protease
VAAAHVSGVVALLLERDPSLDAATIHEILTISAKDLGSKGRDNTFGWGLVDPARALQELESKLAEARNGSARKPAGSRPGPVSAR